MNDQHKVDYRLRTDLAERHYRFEVTRRHLLGAGWLVTFAADAQSPAGRIHVADDGGVTLFTGKVELGQGSRTLLAQAVAEELRVPFARVKVVMGDTDLCPDDGGTWASSTTPQTLPVVRQAAALIRDASLTPPGEWKTLGTIGFPGQ